MNAPWREEWIRELSARERAGKAGGVDEKAGKGPDTGSFLRDAWLSLERDEEHHVIVRVGGVDDPAGGIVMLNKYPYTGGHLLVALGDARPRLMDYDEAQRAALWRLVDLATLICETALEPQGVNVGINIGRAAGAGVPQHLHAHVIPRWIGDVNFLTSVGQVRLINASLDRVAEVYRATWRAIASGEEPPKHL